MSDEETLNQDNHIKEWRIQRLRCPCNTEPFDESGDIEERSRRFLEEIINEYKDIGLDMQSQDSSFEMLDQHDPILSRLATQLFRKNNDYLQGEVASGSDHYLLLEEINHLTITKYTDLRNLALNLNRTLTEYNELYSTTIKPLLSQVDTMDLMVAKLEENAYRLDSYTKQLKTRIKDMYEAK